MHASHPSGFDAGSGAGLAFSALVSACALTCLIVPAFAADAYVAVDISRSAVAGPQPQLRASRPASQGINAWGDLAGSGWPGTNDVGESASGKPFVFDRRTGTRTNLGNLNEDYGWGGDLSSSAYALNDAAWVAGVSYSGENSGSALPFLWVDANTNGYRDGDEMLELDPNSGAGSGYAKSLNNAGYLLVTGNGLWRASVTNEAGAVYETGDRVQLSADYASTYDLNEAGGACWAVAGSSPTYGFRWMDSNANGEVDPGEKTRLTSPWGGDRCAAYSINAHGQVCGYAKDLISKSRGFLWTDLNTNGVAEAAEFLALTTNYPAANIFPHGVNDRGTVVGGVAEGGGRFAFVWDAVNGLRNLNSLFTLSHPVLGDFSARQAVAVNEAGQIGVYGRFGTNTSEYAILLSPRPSIASAAWRNDILTLRIDGLILSTTATVERASSPATDDWVGVDGFIPVDTEQIWTQLMTAVTGHFRVHMDNMDR